VGLNDRQVELQHKAALEQDSTVFDYDGYYDEMKAKAAPPPRAREKEKVPLCQHREVLFNSNL
jgi:coiled-coil domain-containing protein 55